MRPRLLEYEGEVYIRPLDRGIHLNGIEGEPYLDETIELLVGSAYSPSSGWKGRLRISVEVIPDPDD